MTDEDILQGIAEVARTHIKVAAALAPDTHLLRDLHLDSMAQLTLVAELENRFRIVFDAGDEHGLETIADVVRVIKARLRESTTHG